MADRPNNTEAFLAAVLGRHPEWRNGSRPDGCATEENGWQYLMLDVPAGSNADRGHRLQATDLGNSIELAYVCPGARGPAEALFVFEPEERDDAVLVIADWIEDLISGKLQVVRTGDLLGFSDLHEPGRRSTVYTW